jgi:hypothetical protein
VPRRNLAAVLAALADRVPNEEALALAPVAGWLLLVAATSFAALGVVYREPLRRLWFRLEDPRTLGVFRIAFGVCCLCSVNGLWELLPYLFTDEGVLPAEAARQLLAADQFAGYGNGIGDDPHGFFDTRAVLRWLAGPRWSLLLFWDSPTFFWVHFAAFQIAMLCLIAGIATRWTKWIAWFLFHSIIGRNTIYWEGTEHVYRTFFFYLCLSQCDRAYSVDNWLRVRKLRRAGDTRSPIHRLVPAWPRLLVVLQCAALYCYTGAVKNGSVWWAGDALYYAISLDHFHRVPPQPVAAVLGTNLFRVATHVAHAWEVLFPLLVVGMWLRFVQRSGAPPPSPTARRVAQVAWVSLVASSAALVWWLMPVHEIPAPRGTSIESLRTGFVVGWVALALVIAHGWARLRDVELCRWFLGRRVWVTIGVVFHLHLILAMNIGWFSPGALTGFICFFSGRELVAIVRRLRRRPPDDGSTLERHADIERGRDDRRVPANVLAIAIAWLVLGVVLRVYVGIGYGWILLGAFALAAGHSLRASSTGRADTPLAYGPIGRLCIGALGLYHCVGVAVWLLPDKDSFTWRTEAHKPFAWWLKSTQTSQGWKMFAPNPPRRNVFLRVLVTDTNGEQWDMNTDVYAPEKRPIPWIWYTRERKINRRVAGGEGGGGVKWQRWHARWWCKQWIVAHGGEVPRQVELIEVSYPIPTPQWLRDNGPYDPATRLREKGAQKSLLTIACATEPEARPSAQVMTRHGLQPLADDIDRWPALRGRLRSWTRKAAQRQGDAEADD